MEEFPPEGLWCGGGSGPVTVQMHNMVEMMVKMAMEETKVAVAVGGTVELGRGGINWNHSGGNEGKNGNKVKEKKVILVIRFFINGG